MSSMATQIHMAGMICTSVRRQLVTSSLSALEEHQEGADDQRQWREPAAAPAQLEDGPLDGLVVAAPDGVDEAADAPAATARRVAGSGPSGVAPESWRRAATGAAPGAVRALRSSWSTVTGRPRSDRLRPPSSSPPRVTAAAPHPTPSLWRRSGRGKGQRYRPVPGRPTRRSLDRTARRRRMAHVAVAPGR